MYVRIVLYYKLSTYYTTILYGNTYSLFRSDWLPRLEEMIVRSPRIKPVTKCADTKDMAGGRAGGGGDKHTKVLDSSKYL